MDQLEGVLQRLRDQNAQVRTEETFLVPAHFDYLGCYLISNGIKPHNK